MKCSHGLPYESKCSCCVSEALKLVIASQKLPKPLTATAAEVERFWTSAYHVDLDMPVKR